MQIYVGNLATTITDDDLRRVFAHSGAVFRANVVTDLISGASKGFGFVHMTNHHHAEAAIVALNNSTLEGCVLCVNEVRPLVRHSSLPALG